MGPLEQQPDVQLPLVFNGPMRLGHIPAPVAAPRQARQKPVPWEPPQQSEHWAHSPVLSLPPQQKLGAGSSLPSCGILPREGPHWKDVTNIPISLNEAHFMLTWVQSLLTGFQVYHKRDQSMYRWLNQGHHERNKHFLFCHLSWSPSLSLFPSFLNLEILGCSNSHWNKSAFLCFRQPPSSPFT